MSLFLAAAAVGAAAQDLCYGEVIGFRPYLKGEYAAAGPDPARPEQDLTGIFDQDVVTAHPVGSGANTHDTVDVTASSAQVEFDLALFAAETDRPRQGDRLVLLERAGSPRYRIVSARPDDVDRLVCIVAPLGTAP